MTIHWWATNEAVERLAEGRISERDSMGYAIVSAILYSQGTYYVAGFGGSDRSWLLLYEFILVTTIALVGVNECFKANGGGRGKDFLKRLSVISVPLGIRIALAGTIIGQIAYFGFPHLVTKETFRDPYHVYQLFCFASSAAFMSIFYWRLTIHFSRLARLRGANLKEQERLKD